ncbi:DedA family protein [Paenibacillus donghaensis]|jgi:membrane protein DedA with SNARE-associated domain|uniref:DedA family protein n=1 Tax=Paenibacillus donghaensis TaxID=414771 RepID=UPI001883ABE8|nr:DedA family protein [Paenibacillus donghaensis]MBE9916809.1 DedA family protein [Paenibacillus donghaensis]
MEWMNNLFEQYGYLVLFIGLFSESLAIPFPGELAMAISGHMSSLGNFHIPLIIFYSYVGAIVGTTVTYYIGYKLGTPFLERYGKYVLLNQARLAKVTSWFGKYGNKLILISYFVPGLRHFTGYVSGVLKIRLRTFIILDFIGGLVWVLAYVMIGKLLGPNIEQLLHVAAKYFTASMFILAAIVALVVLFKKYKKRNGGFPGVNSSSPKQDSDQEQD